MNGEVGNFTLTGGVIAVVAIGLIIFDIYLWLAKKPTISVVKYNWGWYKPHIPFTIGYICGHWFW
jgi:Ni/Fe-hydrogenase subunit HybB-like protein